ncbi:MAG: HAMP domain-containing histidine kinase, partial [Muribaculaceae bacterium]|nr:HAMP domain-containing histidine kinase [Muribaculaceae bacterium]
LVALGAGVAVWMLVALVWRLASLMSMFLKGVLARDTTMQLDFGRRDPMLRDLAEDMNSISTIYRESNRQLETSKLYYDRILKIMTHEMRNYVAPVISLTSDVAEHPGRYASLATLGEVVSLIHSQSLGISRFLDSYYRLTHLPPPELVEVTAAEFVSRLLPLLRGELETRGLEATVLRFDVMQGVTMTVDVALMTQVMLNLVRNALDAVAGVAGPRVAITFTMSAGRPYITVADNGPGIAPEMAENLFQPFFTTKPGGCGVGLAISRQIVRRHGGDLTFLPSRHTTTFALSLP